MTTIKQWNETFKLGRRAGQEDVCLEILRHDPSFAHQIAREYISRIPGHERPSDEQASHS